MLNPALRQRLGRLYSGDISCSQHTTILLDKARYCWLCQLRQKLYNCTHADLNRNNRFLQHVLGVTAEVIIINISVKRCVSERDPSHTACKDIFLD